MSSIKVSVVLPVRNEKGFIDRSLGSVIEQDYPADLVQVLVVDGMSDDGTPERVRRIMAAHPGRDIRLLDNPGRIVPTGFNLALKHVTGDVVVRVDGHCEVAPDYVSRCVALLRSTGAQNVGGLQRAAGAHLLGRAIAKATSSRFGVGNARFHYAAEAGWADTVYLGAWPRSVFDAIGGFDEELVRNQDDEFNFRLRQAGGKIWLDPSIRSVYYSRADLRKLWRQYYQYGFYKVRVMQKRGGLASWRHLVPALFVLALLGSLFLSLATGNVWWFVAVAGPYLAASLAASLSAARRDWPVLPILPVAFLILHTAYGAGFLHGLWHWRKAHVDRDARPAPQRPAEPAVSPGRR